MRTKFNTLNQRRSSTGLDKWYALAGLSILLISTAAWSLLSARLQNANADQLVDVYLLGHSTTLQQATFSGAHTFLLKWPIFVLVKLWGLSSLNFVLSTMVLTLLTIGGLAYALFRIEKRPLMLGTWYIALASLLMLVPPTPYAGALLPVNMAMLATRNIEYLIYILSLVLLIRWPNFKSRRFWLGIILLTLLIASDKLFLTLSAGGAILALLVYALSKTWGLAVLSAHWLAGTLVASIGATILLWLLNIFKVTHISSGSSANPYNLVHSSHQLGQGIIYAATGLATNFGANPGFDATMLRTIPHLSSGRILGPGGPEFIINFIVFLALIWASAKLVIKSLRLNSQESSSPDTASKLSLALIWSSLTALGVFVLTNHYYPVDARYLTITLFAFVIGTVTLLRDKDWQPKKLIWAGGIITLFTLLGSISVLRNYHADRLALLDTTNRNTQIVQVLARHPVDTLVGDYWRVIPAQFQSKNKFKVTPLANCTSERDVLSSHAWQPNLNTHSFAYLLSFDKSLTDYPSCSLQEVTSFYGHPNSSTLISGTLTNPKEILLFYDQGIHKATSAPTVSAAARAATVVPISLDQQPHTNCGEPTTMNIVAHQDDDILFMNPDIQHDIDAGQCVRTIYITAGDDGSGQFYWLQREQGSEAAYSHMAGLPNQWVQRIVQLNAHEFITIANPRGNSKISLIFMHLPDGNLGGQGFKATHYQSLSNLATHKINSITSVDGQSNYTNAQLISALSDLMITYGPAQINTQANYISRQYPDHSDHMLVGSYVKLAYAQYENQQFGNQVTIPLKFYIGYPIHSMAVDVSGDDLTKKEATWFAYAKFDGNVCQTLASCTGTSTYGFYLTRQYQNAY